MTGTTPDRFAEIEAEVDRGEPWMFREPGAPNPLTLEVSGLSTGFTKFGEATWLNGVDHPTGSFHFRVIGSDRSTSRVERIA